MPHRPTIIVQVITRLIVGGAQLTLLGLCEGLREHFDLRVICGPDEGPEGSLRRQVEAVVPVLVLPTLRRDVRPFCDIAAARALRRIFVADVPAIIHTHSSKAGVLGRIAAPRPPARVVHTVHGWGHTPADPWLVRKFYVQIERSVARRTDALIAVSADVRDEGNRLGIGRRRDYVVIPEYVDYTSRSPDFHAARARARETLGLTENDRVLGWIGRFVPQKAPELLLTTLQRTLFIRRDARAVLVGDGPERQEVEHRIEDLGLSERVLFPGLRLDARDLIPAFDVLLHVSRWEGQPRVVQEAIAERIPVVATRVSGLADIVLHGKTGYLVEPDHVSDLVDATLRILEQRDLAAPLPRAVVADVAQRHGHVVALQRHLRLYDQLLRRRDARPS